MVPNPCSVAGFNAVVHIIEGIVRNGDSVSIIRISVVHDGPVSFDRKSIAVDVFIEEDNMRNSRPVAAIFVVATIVCIVVVIGSILSIGQTVLSLVDRSKAPNRCETPVWDVRSAAETVGTGPMVDESNVCHEQDPKRR